MPIHETHMIKLFLFVISYAITQSLFAQFDTLYRPLTFEGTVPPHFSQYLTGDQAAGDAFADGLNSLSEEQRGDFTSLSQHALSQAMRSGSIYLNPEINNYLSKLVDYLLRDQPDLRKSIHIYGTKILIPNASCWADGTLFVNLSLLPYLDNEAQLAFILCHEISHFQKKHSLQAFQKEEELREQISSDTDKLFDFLRFSREHELEADVSGLDLYLKTSYPPSEALEALKQLEKVNLQSQYQSLNLDSLFALPMMDLDSVYSCSAGVSGTRGFLEMSKFKNVQIDTGNDLTQSTQTKKNTKRKEEEEESLPSTHPSIEERIEAIETVLSQTGDSANATYQSYVFSQDEFRRLRTLAIFEYVNIVYQKGYYLSSLYQSLRMAQYYPHNEFLQEIAGQSLYWMVYFDEIGQIDEVIPKRNGEITTAYEKFACSMGKMEFRTLRKLAKNFLTDRLEAFPTSGTLLISLAKVCELNDEKDVAQGYFQAYGKKFPTGPDAAYANYKTSQLK